MGPGLIANSYQLGKPPGRAKLNISVLVADRSCYLLHTRRVGEGKPDAQMDVRYCCSAVLARRR
jgi:hypothetical protein